MVNEASVLVHLGGGMGDVLLATPMMEMLGRAGFAVDVCVQGETRQTADLLQGLPFLRTVSSEPDVFVGNYYGYYIFGDMIKGGPIPFRDRQHAITLHPKWNWLRGHELYSEVEMYTHLARAISPDAPVANIPSVMTSGRVFPEISKRTVVLVPGGQRTLILRTWPYFGDLAKRFDDVAVVGTPSDLDISNRIIFKPWLRKMLQGHLKYRGAAWRLARHFADRHDTPIVFPPHTKNFVGKLSILDTAALIRQAGLVIGNDCGVTHLSVALRQNTLVALGPTSKRRVYPDFWSHVRTVNRNYECQPCQEKNATVRAWFESPTQSFCPHRLRCLDDLTVDEVEKVARQMLTECG